MDGLKSPHECNPTIHKAAEVSGIDCSVAIDGGSSGIDLGVVFGAVNGTDINGSFGIVDEDGIDLE